MAKMTCLSGVARLRTLTTSESPPHCTRTPVEGVPARSSARASAELRQKVKGDSTTHRWRRGGGSGKRPSFGLQHQLHWIGPVVWRLLFGVCEAYGHLGRNALPIALSSSWDWRAARGGVLGLANFRDVSSAALALSSKSTLSFLTTTIVEVTTQLTQPQRSRRNSAQATTLEREAD